jgi:hypothetical protein
LKGLNVDLDKLVPLGDISSRAYLIRVTKIDKLWNCPVSRQTPTHYHQAVDIKVRSYLGN